MKIIATSFKRSHACTATLSTSNPAAGHHQPTTLLETPGHSQASLGQSLLGSLLLSPGFWCAQSTVCALQESVSPVLCKFWQLYGGVNGNLLQEGLFHTQVCCTQSPCPCCKPLLICTSAQTLKHSPGSVSVGSWVLVLTRFIWALWASLVGMGFDSKHNFAPPTILLGLLLCPWMWGISSQLFQHCAATTPAPTILLGFSALGLGISPHSCSSAMQPPPH